MDNKFKKGLLLGGILGAAALLGFTMTKKGKKFEETVHQKVQDQFKEVTNELKKRLSELQDITQAKFNSLVETIVKEFAKKKALALDIQKNFIQSLQDQWTEVETPKQKVKKVIKKVKSGKKK